MRLIVTLSLAAGLAVLSYAVEAKTAIFAKPAGPAVGIGGAALSPGFRKVTARPTVRPGAASVGGALSGPPRVSRVNATVRQPIRTKTAAAPPKIVKGVVGKVH